MSTRKTVLRKTFILTENTNAPKKLGALYEGAEVFAHEVRLRTVFFPSSRNTKQGRYVKDTFTKVTIAYEKSCIMGWVRTSDLSV